MDKQEKKDWYPGTDEEYGQTAEAFKDYLTDSANLAAQGWDAQTNAEANGNIMTSVIPKATALDTAYKNVHVHGDNSNAVEERNRRGRSAYRRCCPPHSRLRCLLIASNSPLITRDYLLHYLLLTTSFAEVFLCPPHSPLPPTPLCRGGSPHRI